MTSGGDDENDILRLFRERRAAGDVLRVCAPMVRYSKLAFRLTVLQHGVDVCYSPMIVADSFVRSARARAMDFQTSAADTCVRVLV